MDKKMTIGLFLVILASWSLSWIYGFNYGISRGVRISDETYARMKNEEFNKTLIFPDTKEFFFSQNHEISKNDKNQNSAVAKSN